MALPLAGCESVTSEKIQTWKGTEKGPRKLQDAVKDGKLDPQLRAEAAAALVEIGMAEQSEALVAAMPPAERTEVVTRLVPIYVKGTANESVAKAREARDALFGIRGYAAPAQIPTIDQALLASVEKDMKAGRTSGGRHSIDKILTALGPAATPLLVQMISQPTAPVESIADLLGKVPDQATRERAGAALVQRAVASRGDIPIPLWRAMANVGGPSVNSFLTAKVIGGSEKEAVAAAQALQAKGDPSALPLALQVAADRKANKAVRDEMFGLCEKIGGPKAQQGLIQIIASDPEELVRYRAYEAALAVGKGQAIQPALEAFSEKTSFKREDVVDFLVKDIQKIGSAAKPVLPALLTSRSALARMTGVLAYEAMGGAADAPAVLKSANDKGTVKGFPAGDTVGKEAARVAGLLTSKKG